jgi:hypothetical protein
MRCPTTYAAMIDSLEEVAGVLRGATPEQRVS